MSLLEIKDLTTSFATDQGKVQAVRGISLSVEQGEIVGIVGESGSGKSQSMYSVMGLLSQNGTVEEGSILFDGKEISPRYFAGGEREYEKYMESIRGNTLSMIFQDPMSFLNPVLTIEKQLVEPLKNHRKIPADQLHQKAVELLTQVGIPSPEERLRQYPHQLSGGMRQRVIIAIALACTPKMIIADEPTTALDVTIQAQILELMQELRKKLGMSIIMITHDLGVVASMCEKIAVMYAGHIVEYGTTDEIFYQPGHEYTKGLINSIPKLNTEVRERLVPIEGTPVDLLNPPAGCPFAPRCKNCMKICLSKMPPRTELSDTHYTYCWLQQKAAFEKGEKAE